MSNTNTIDSDDNIVNLYSNNPIRDSMISSNTNNEFLDNYDSRSDSTNSISLHIDDDDESEIDARGNFITKSESPSKSQYNDNEYSSSSDNDDDLNDFDVPDLDEVSDEEPEHIVDDNGEIIEEIPQKKRVVSTYSEVGSTWNAFPTHEGNDNDDVKTVITDIKTIYDNNTLMNVPMYGTMNSSHELPPLPNIRDLNLNDQKMTTINENDSLKSQHKNSLAKDIQNGELPFENDPLPSNKNPLPETSIVKIIQATNVAHDRKLLELRKISQDLSNYDSGIGAWISNTLKSTSGLKLKEDYVINKHVKEAYMNADTLSRRNNMHIVSDINQNVQQLTKKVFNSSMKGKSKSFLRNLRDKKSAN
ncbi:uncharacterized protein HGUI_01950 [Hanseniaspora guilliermondii]|uniref:Protein FYV8 n=1 Tax=Hanseniaspora guilliermondii TaxID=56406 RepID=A0A1L0FJH9_9ASCO|nr:uncharacterized protein HGUI_01950 [Hanseniaspora guilliermondii]